MLTVSELFNARFKILNQTKMKPNQIIILELSLDRLRVNRLTGQVYSNKGNELRLLKPYNNDRYHQYTSYHKGEKINIKAHQIVWMSAYGDYDREKYVIDHIDDNPHNNALSNLQLLTRSQNSQKRKRARHNFKPSQKVQMHWLYNFYGMRIKEIALHFGCSDRYARMIIKAQSEKN